MRDISTNRNALQKDYYAGFARVLRFAEQAKAKGWKITDRQLVHEIMQRERAIQIQRKSSLPILGQTVRSIAWNQGQADALRMLLRIQHERSSGT